MMNRIYKSSGKTLCCLFVVLTPDTFLTCDFLGFKFSVLSDLGAAPVWLSFNFCEKPCKKYHVRIEVSQKLGSGVRW